MRDIIWYDSLRICVEKLQVVFVSGCGHVGYSIVIVHADMRCARACVQLLVRMPTCVHMI